MRFRRDHIEGAAMQRPVQVSKDSRGIEDVPDSISHPIIVTTLLCFAFGTIAALIVALHVLPLTDGWYEALIYLQSKGLKTYKDIEFVLPPMTPLFYALMDFTTGDNLAAHKAIGVALSLLNAGLIYLWLSRTYPKTASLLSAFVFFLLETTFPTYLARDYHSLVNFFAIPCVAIMFDEPYGAPKPFNIRLVIMAALAGLLTALLFLTKQNVGLLIAVAFLSFLIGSFVVNAATVRSVRYTLPQAAYSLAYVASLTVGIFAVVSIAVPDASVLAFCKSLLNVQAKGSPLYIATRIVHDPSNARILELAFALSVFLVLCLHAVQYLQTSQSPLLSKKPSIARDLVLIGSPVMVASLFGYVFIIRQEAMTSHGLFALVTIAFYIIDGFDNLKIFDKAKKTDGASILRLMIFGALIYANTLSASINVVGTCLLLAYYFSSYADKLLQWTSTLPLLWSRLIVFGTVLGLLSISITFEINKAMHPYAWWDTTEPSIFSDSTPSAQKPLEGMYLSRNRSQLIDSFVGEIKALTNPSDPILVYPNIPLFYLLADRMPMTRSYVQWFDFARTETVAEDFKNVSASPPKLIVEMVTPLDVYLGHEVLIGHKLLQYNFAEYLQCMVNKNAFAQVDLRLYSQSTSVAGNYVFTTDNPISAEQIFAFSNFLRAKYPHDVVERVQTPSALELSLKQLATHPLTSDRVYSQIIVHGSAARMNDIIHDWAALSGIKFSLSSNSFVRVLKRLDGWNERGASCHNSLLQALTQPEE